MKLIDYTKKTYSDLLFNHFITIIDKFFNENLVREILTDNHYLVEVAITDYKEVILKQLRYYMDNGFLNTDDVKDSLYSFFSGPYTLSGLLERDVIESEAIADTFHSTVESYMIILLSDRLSYSLSTIDFRTAEKDILAYKQMTNQ